MKQENLERKVIVAQDDKSDSPRHYFVYYGIDGSSSEIGLRHDKRDLIKYVHGLVNACFVETHTRPEIQNGISDEEALGTASPTFLGLPISKKVFKELMRTIYPESDNPEYC